MSAPQVSDEVLCDTLLAEIRCARIRAELVKLDFDFIGMALKNHLVSPEQAMAELHARDCLPWMFQDREGTA